MTPEIGKRYRTSNGQTTSPLTAINCPTHGPFTGVTAGGWRCIWTTEGEYLTAGIAHDYDLVALAEPVVRLELSLHELAAITHALRRVGPLPDQETHENRALADKLEHLITTPELNEH